jgi:hypothetical protein
MNVPSIYDLVKNAQNDLKSKEELLKDLEKEPLNAYIVDSLKEEIHNLKFLLSRFKIKLRNEKINELGI